MENSIASKIEMLSKTVMKDAETEKKYLCEQMEAERRKRVGEKEDEFLRAAYEEIQGTASDVHKTDSEMVLKEQNEAKKQLLLKREAIIEKVFAKVAEKISAYTATEQYRGKLAEEIEKACKAAGEGRKTVHLCERDKDVLKETDAVSLQTVADEDMLGGVKVVNHDRNIVVNCSYKTLLEKERAEFLTESGLTIL